MHRQRLGAGQLRHVDPEDLRPPPREPRLPPPEPLLPLFLLGPVRSLPPPRNRGFRVVHGQPENLQPLPIKQVHRNRLLVRMHQHLSPHLPGSEQNLFRFGGFFSRDDARVCDAGRRFSRVHVRADAKVSGAERRHCGF